MASECSWALRTPHRAATRAPGLFDSAVLRSASHSTARTRPGTKHNGMLRVQLMGTCMTSKLGDSVMSFLLVACPCTPGKQKEHCRIFVLVSHASAYRAHAACRAGRPVQVFELMPTRCLARVNNWLCPCFSTANQHEHHSSGPVQCLAGQRNPHPRPSLAQPSGAGL